MDVVQLISAAGIGGILGSVITTLLQSWILNKQRINDRIFQEKKESYLGLIMAYRNAVISGNDKDKEFAYWSVRCNLLAPLSISKLINDMKTDNFSIQEKAFSELQIAMKDDLGF